MKDAPSPIGRLLQEISWEGNARKYRDGGRGKENVLTVEVFQALDLLPRSVFLRAILESVCAASSATASVLAREAESVSFSLLPGALFLRPAARSGAKPVEVQPDAILESPSVYCLLEAKRIKPSSFFEQQLAREYLATLQHAKERERSPLLLLVLPVHPPIKVKRLGHMSLRDLLTETLPDVLKRTDQNQSVNELVEKSDSVIGVVTWSEITSCLDQGVERMGHLDASVANSLARLAGTASRAITWHL